MKRIAGSMLLLAGLSGCISPSGNNGQGEKKTADAKSTITVPASNGFDANPNVPMSTAWSPHPTAGREPMAAKMAPSGGMVASCPAPAPVQTLASPTGPVPPPAPAILQASAVLPASLVPMVTTPPSVSTPPALFPASVSVATMPRSEIGKDQSVTTVSASQPGDLLTTTAKLDPTTPPREFTLTPVPVPEVAPKKTVVADPRPIKVATPLMRLVNTKRITLNFEVKDVGPSGLANVELWYTQNCRDWKKYDAPTNSKAYVVEVDEEGMYGFTLVARSGLGLSKEPPASGDQPQVWTIVDLTPPEVQLTEVTPNIDAKQPQVTIGWKASDKNFSRSPISLLYSETEAGPWRVIAANLENTGKFTWQMPTGTPPKFIVRVEATDLAGNISRVQSAKPLLLDNSTPTVLITNVEANASQ